MNDLKECFLCGCLEGTHPVEWKGGICKRFVDVDYKQEKINAMQVPRCTCKDFQTTGKHEKGCEYFPTECCEKSSCKERKCDCICHRKMPIPKKRSIESKNGYCTHECYMEDGKVRHVHSHQDTASEPWIERFENQFDIEDFGFSETYPEIKLFIQKERDLAAQEAIDNFKFLIEPVTEKHNKESYELGKKHGAEEAVKRVVEEIAESMQCLGVNPNTEREYKRGFTDSVTETLNIIRSYLPKE